MAQAGGVPENRGQNGVIDPAAQVRQWLLSATTATLCTLAAEAEVAGWPFGSLAPFALGRGGTPVEIGAAEAREVFVALAQDARARVSG